MSGELIKPALRLLGTLIVAVAGVLQLIFYIDEGVFPTICFVLVFAG